MQHYVGWMLVAIGVLIASACVVFLVAPSVSWLGRLPGDIRIEGGGFRFYFPHRHLYLDEPSVEPGKVAMARTRWLSDGCFCGRLLIGRQPE